MKTYPEVYLDDVVETQGRLFDKVSQEYPDTDTENFINSYMNSRTRRYIDDGQAYVCTMNADELLDYFMKTDGYNPVHGKAIEGFMPDWIGEFYALYQWSYKIPSSDVVKKVPVRFLEKAYPGMHDLDLDLAVKKVGRQ